MICSATVRLILSLSLTCSAFVCLATPAEGQQQRPPTIRNFNTPGNLESTHNLGCIETKEALPQYNPIDLYKAASTCIAVNRYDDAVRLFSLAGAYGKYDMLRVSDVTAHQAITVAKMEYSAVFRRRRRGSSRQ